MLQRRPQLFWFGFCFFEFYGELRLLTFFNKAYDAENYQLDAYEIHNLIEQEYKKGVLKKEEVKRMLAFRLKIVNSIYPEDKFIEMTENHGFKLIEIFEDKNFRFTKSDKNNICTSTYMHKIHYSNSHSQ